MLLDPLLPDLLATALVDLLDHLVPTRLLIRDGLHLCHELPVPAAQAHRVCVLLPGDPLVLQNLADGETLVRLLDKDLLQEGDGVRMELGAPLFVRGVGV
jgi:hypothetical protein